MDIIDNYTSINTVTCDNVSLHYCYLFCMLMKCKTYTKTDIC